MVQEEYFDQTLKIEVIKYFYLMEYANDGNLLEHIIKKEFSKEEILRTIQNVLEGLKYLHKKKIVHGDIKPQNIVLFKDGSIKLCDLENVKDMNYSIPKSLVGTPGYTAPKIIKGGEYDEKSDIWSFRIMLLQLFTRKSIFQLKQSDFLEQIDDLEINNLCKNCLQENPLNMKSISSILNQIAETNEKIRKRSRSASDLLNLGYSFEHGTNMTMDFEKAFDYYRMSAEKGNYYAQFKLGYFYEKGLGVDKIDLEQSFHYYELSANQGFSKAHFCLGECFRYGKGTDLCMKQALYHYELSAILKNSWVKT